MRLVACGTSWHAALAGKFMIEKLARVPVEVDYGSEFRYRDPIVDETVLTVVISQSGETADTLAAQREAKQKGSKTLAICNVVGSMITREAVGTLLTHAGPEIGVASTKAFTSQLTAMFLLAVHLAQARRGDSRMLAAQVQELVRIPAKMEIVLSNDAHYEELARTLFRATDFLFLGRGVHYPIALEGALKLKEISYIHAEGYPAGEMKHGPNALIDESLPVVVLATREAGNDESRVRYEKTLSNIQEVKARGGIVVAVACEPDRAEVARVAAHVISIPEYKRAAVADSRDRSAPTAGVPHRRAPRLRRRPAAQSRQERHCRMMRQWAHHLTVATRGKGFYEVTEEVSNGWRKRAFVAGLLTLFLQHTSASLLIQENADPDVVRDLEAFFSRIAPEDSGLYRHTVEGPDDMPAHIRAALTQVQLSIPVVDGRPALGTWQGVYVFEHRSAPHRRRVVMHVAGE